MIIISFLYSAVSINLIPAKDFKEWGGNSHYSLLKDALNLYSNYIPDKPGEYDKMIDGYKLNQSDIIIGDIGYNNGRCYIQDKYSGKYYYSNKEILSLSSYGDKVFISPGDKISIITLFNVIYFATKKQHFPLKPNLLVDVDGDYKIVELIITSDDIKALYKKLEGNPRVNIINNNRAILSDFYNLLKEHLPEKKFEVKDRNKKNEVVSLSIKLEIVDNLAYIKKWYKGVPDGRLDEGGLSINFSLYKENNVKYMVEEVIDRGEYSSLNYLSAGDPEDPQAIQLFRIFTMMINGFDNIIDEDRLDDFVYIIPKKNKS